MNIKIKSDYIDHSISLPGRKHNIQMRFLPLEMYSYVYSIFPQMFTVEEEIKDIIEKELIEEKPKRKKNDKSKN